MIALQAVDHSAVCAGGLVAVSGDFTGITGLSTLLSLLVTLCVLEGGYLAVYWAKGVAWCDAYSFGCCTGPVHGVHFFACLSWWTMEFSLHAIWFLMLFIAAAIAANGKILEALRGTGYRYRCPLGPLPAQTQTRSAALLLCCAPPPAPIDGSVAD